MNEKTLKQIANKIESYLQNDHAEEWHVKTKEESLVVYYTNFELFTLTYDEDVDSWYFSGESMDMDMITDINKILKEITYENFRND